MLNDENQVRFEAIVKKARRNRRIANEMLQAARAQNLDDLKAPPDVSDMIDAAVESEADVAAEFCRWIETLTEEQQGRVVEFVAAYEKGISFIGVPFVTSFLGIEKNQAKRIREALARRKSNLQRFRKA